MYSLRVVKFIYEDSLQNIRCNITMEGLFTKKKSLPFYDRSSTNCIFMAPHNATGSYCVLILCMFIFQRNGISARLHSLGLPPVTSVPWVHFC
jgi:hypothetical protein